MPSVSLLLLSAVLSSLLLQSEGRVRGVSIPLGELDGHEDNAAQNHRNLQVPVPKKKVSPTGSLTYQRGGVGGMYSRSMTSRGSSKGMGSSDDDPMCFRVSNSEFINGGSMANTAFLGAEGVVASCPINSSPLSVSCELDLLGDGLALVTSTVGGMTALCLWQCLNTMNCFTALELTTEAVCCRGSFPIV